MNKTERLVKLATDENGYQDIFKDGKKIFEGYRDCEERWNIIDEYIHPNQVTVDLGSNYGYFAYKVATKDPSNLVWSIESDDLRHEVHQLMLEVNNMENVVLSKHQISLIDLLNLNRTCETVDMFLAFSVIHYFPMEQIPSILEAISRFSRALVIEFPSPDEDHVANKELVDKLNPEQMLNQVYDIVKIIGSVPSPKHENIKRDIYFCENYSITRDRAKSYLNAKVGKSHKVELKNGWWTIDDQKRRITGLNLGNLAAFNVTYPSIDYLMDKSAQSYYGLIQHQEGKVTDIHPRNVLVGAREVHIIDFKENLGKKIYDISWKQYKDRCLKADKETIKKDLALKFATGDTRAFLKEDTLRIGIIARADKTGLGQGQTLRLVKLLNPDKVMVIDSTPFKKIANKQYYEWYDGYNTTNVHGLPTTQDVDRFLNDIDIIISCETFYSYYFVSEAKKRGIKSALIFNYEFLDNLLYPNIEVPDTLIQPSQWYLGDMAARFGAVYLPTPIFADEFAKAREVNLNRKNTRHYLFINGKTAVNDRNGLNSLYAALRRAKGDFTITIKAQNDIERINDPRVTYDFSNPDDQNDLYEGFDALILPRRYAGQSLPMCEALSAGLPVVMTNIDPNNKVLPREWLVEAKVVHKFMVRAMIDVHDANPIKLAAILDTLDVGVEAKAKAVELSKEYDPITLLPKYKQVLGL